MEKLSLINTDLMKKEKGSISLGKECREESKKKAS